MNHSIQLYDQLHSCGREEAMSLEEANAEGCSFYDNEATRQAFEDFKKCFRSFCEEQNCIEGEPFAQEPPSIKKFLDLHKATKRPSRRLKIGVKAPPVVSIHRGDDKIIAVPAPLETPRHSVLKQRAPSPKATLLSEAEPVLPVKEMRKLSVDESDETFQSYVEGSNFAAFKDSVFFLPKNCEADFLKNKAEYVKRHAFQGKRQVLDNLQRFRNFMRSSNWSAANEIEIVSLTGRSHKVANIAFDFRSLDDCLANEESIPFVKMLNIAPLKQ